MRPAASRVLTIAGTELRTLLRDRRTVVMSIVLPLLVMPVMLFASRAAEERRERELAAREYHYAVEGPRAAQARDILDEALAHPLPADTPGAEDAGAATFRRLDVADADAALADGTLDVYVRAGTVEARRQAREAIRAAGDRDRDGETGEDQDEDADEEGDPADRYEALPPDVTALTIVYRGDRDQSEAGADRLRVRLAAERERQRAVRLEAAGGPPPGTVLPLDAVSIASDERVAGLALGRIATALLMFFLFAGGAVVAQDTLAGEKERGTLETLLTSAATRREIVAAKFLVVLAVAVAITAIQVGNLLAYARLELIPAARDLAAVVTPGLAAGLLLFVLPVAALVSAALLLVSGYARSYREAQLLFMPVLLACVAPALAAALPSLPLRSAIVLVPIANISIGVKEMLTDRVDLPFLAAAWLVTLAAAGWLMRQAEQALSTERLIVPGAGDLEVRPGVPVLRPGHVFTWFAGMWAVLLLVDLNLGADLDIRAQLLINLPGIFLGGSLLFIRRYGLTWTQVLAWRAPAWPAWIAVLAGAPAGLITGVAVFRLADLVVPVPREMMESFSQYLLPDDMPFWSLLPMLTLLPGVCEEIAFRGVLLQSLRRFYRPWTAALLTGVIFGLFHMSLFRLLPTAFLGVLLATVTILSGSIFPAMAWHALNNGAAFLLPDSGWSLGELDPVVHVAAAAVLLLSLWILWRSGRQRDAA
ncbi:MAG: ABC transporter permease subunit [Vicinamibacterales bacterium]